MSYNKNIMSDFWEIPPIYYELSIIKVFFVSKDDYTDSEKRRACLLQAVAIRKGILIPSPFFVLTPFSLFFLQRSRSFAYA